MKPGGLIQRVVTGGDPLFRTEYLYIDGAIPEWTDDRKKALFFPTFHEADARALAMGGRPIFACVATKPISHAVRQEHNPQRQRRTNRASARRRREAEMRADDLRELEAIETA